MRLTGVAVAILCVLPLVSRAADKVELDPTAKKAVNRALDHLVTQQNSDGSWSDGRYSHNTAITSFCVLAFLSQGHLPGQGPYGPELARAMRFLMASARDDGYLIGVSGNMYCHAMTTLTLAQLYGMTGDASIKPVLKKAVDLIVRCQSAEGGWRYDPRPSGSDISVTIMQVMALRAGKNSGMHVPDDTLREAIAYINRCYVPEEGGYRYQPYSRDTGFARTAAGICVLQLTGNYNAENIPKSLEYLKANVRPREHFWYGHYYAAHAMHQIGGKEWAAWYAMIRELLLDQQDTDGGWSGRDLDRSSPGPNYQTAIGVIILSVPAGYLPIFQR